MRWFIRVIERLMWCVKCRYKFWLHGAYGLTRTLEEMPLIFLLRYMKKYGADIGTGVIIDSGIIFHRPDSKSPLKNLSIGSDVYIGHRILLDLTDNIVIKDNIAIGADCQIWTHVGDFINGVHNLNDYQEKRGQVILNDGSLIYSRVVLNPGVIVGEKSRVLAMSMVSDNIPANQVWAGIPAKFHKVRGI